MSLAEPFFFYNLEDDESLEATKKMFSKLLTFYILFLVSKAVLLRNIKLHFHNSERKISRSCGNN